MKITLFVVGKLKTAYVKDGIADYGKRLKNYCTFALKEVDAEKIPHEPSRAQIDVILAKEAATLEKNLNFKEPIIVLDRTGKSFPSEKWAEYIAARQNEGRSSIQAVIGGPFGLHESIVKRSSERLSLSAMTYPHELATLVFMEQLYRAHTILKHEPYHK